MGKRELTCSERIAKAYAREIADIRKGVNDSVLANESDVQEFLQNYGLSFDYVACGDFGDNDPEVPYWRWQLSWGGPQDEFRFPHENKEHMYCIRNKYSGVWTGPHTDERMPEAMRCEYWFLDWGDGAHVNLSGKDLAMLREVFRYFLRSGVVLDSFTKAGGTPYYMEAPSDNT